MDRQTGREKELQSRYDKLNFDLQNLQVDYANQNGSTEKTESTEESTESTGD